MSMSKKDFIALADLIRNHNETSARQTRQYGADAAIDAFTPDQIETLAVFCYSQNPRFMRDRWLDYIAGKCGKNGGKVAA